MNPQMFTYFYLTVKRTCHSLKFPIKAHTLFFKKKPKVRKKLFPRPKPDLGDGSLPKPAKLSTTSTPLTNDPLWLDSPEYGDNNDGNAPQTNGLGPTPVVDEDQAGPCQAGPGTDTTLLEKPDTFIANSNS